MKIYTLQEIEGIGYTHGQVFGKYTEQILIDDSLKYVLDNSKQAILAYNYGYNQGFHAGLADTHRTDNFDD